MTRPTRSPKNWNRSRSSIGETPSHRRIFLIGVGLILASSAIGWGALALGSALAAVYGKAAWKIAAFVYFLSWVPFGLGAYLSGREGIHYAKTLIRKKLKS